MTQPATPTTTTPTPTAPTMNQLVAAQAAAKTALMALNQTLTTAKIAWDGALLAWGLEGPRRQLVRRGQPAPVPPASPTMAQQDLTGLATALKAAMTAQTAGQTVYNTAKNAVTAALVAAGAT